MLRKDKEILVEQWIDKLRKSPSVILTEYKGLKVEEINLLRSDLRKCAGEYRVIKNTLLDRVTKELKMDDLSPYFNGPTAIVVERGDPALTARTIVDFSKDHGNLKIKAGFLDGKLVSANQIKEIASLPPRNIMLTILARDILFPIQGLHNVLSGMISQLINVLEATRKKKEEAK